MDYNPMTKVGNQESTQVQTDRQADKQSSDKWDIYTVSKFLPIKYLSIPMGRRVTTVDTPGRPHHNLTIRGNLISDGTKSNHVLTARMQGSFTSGVSLVKMLNLTQS